MRLNPFTILLVEDSKDDAELMLHAFKTIGVKGPLQHVSGGDEAILYLDGKGPYTDREKYTYPSFILTDLKMPLGDGFALLNHLKNAPQWAVIPTVVYSSSSDPDDIRRCYAMGAGSYIVKLAGYAEMLQTFKTFFDYWMLCEVPEVDMTGKIIPTHSGGKMGARFPV